MPASGRAMVTSASDAMLRSGEFTGIYLGCTLFSCVWIANRILRLETSAAIQNPLFAAHLFYRWLLRYCAFPWNRGNYSFLEQPHGRYSSLSMSRWKFASRCWRAAWACFMFHARRGLLLFNGGVSVRFSDVCDGAPSAQFPSQATGHFAASHSYPLVFHFPPKGRKYQ